MTNTNLKTLAKLKGVKTSTFNTALDALKETKLIEKHGKNYLISDLGLFFYPMLEMIERIPECTRDPYHFSAERKPSEWHGEIVSFVVRAQKEIMLTTRRLRTFSDPVIKQVAYEAFKKAAAKPVKIRMIADPSLPRKIQEMFTKEFSADIKYLSSEILENPPALLKPAFLEDFAHVMICDDSDWLYLFPHDDERKHAGIRCLNDPVISKYLANIFDTFWALAS